MFFQYMAIDIVEDQDTTSLAVHRTVELPPIEILEGVLESVDADLVFVRVGADVCVLGSVGVSGLLYNL
jgi:hypothetical protein